MEYGYHQYLVSADNEEIEQSYKEELEYCREKLTRQLVNECARYKHSPEDLRRDVSENPRPLWKTKPNYLFKGGNWGWGLKPRDYEEGQEFVFFYPVTQMKASRDTFSVCDKDISIPEDLQDDWWSWVKQSQDIAIVVPFIKLDDNDGQGSKTLQFGDLTFELPQVCDEITPYSEVIREGEVYSQEYFLTAKAEIHHQYDRLILKAEWTHKEPKSVRVIGRACFNGVYNHGPSYDENDLINGVAFNDGRFVPRFGPEDCIVNNSQVYVYTTKIQIDRLKTTTFVAVRLSEHLDQNLSDPIERNQLLW